MTTRGPPYTWIDDAALAVGLGLVLFGLAVLGFLETLYGTVLAVDLGVVVVQASVGPDVRASAIALGLVVLLAWGLFRLGRAIVWRRTGGA